MITLTIDDKSISTSAGNNLLAVCLAHDIYVPNLCWLESMTEPSASCRLCWVEIEGRPQPVTSCTTIVENDMVVKTDTPAVRRLQQAAFRFLMSCHAVQCKDCPANKKCELQTIAKFLKISLKPKQLTSHLPDPPINTAHPRFDIHLDRCVLCGRCIQVCRTHHELPLLTFVQRGIDTVLGFFPDSISDTACESCRACIDICPVTALTPKKETVSGQ